MHQYICPICGAYLDPGERCTCMDKHRNMYQKKQFNYDCAERGGMLNVLYGQSSKGRGISSTWKTVII